MLTALEQEASSISPRVVTPHGHSAVYKRAARWRNNIDHIGLSMRATWDKKTKTHSQAPCLEILIVLAQGALIFPTSATR